MKKIENFGKVELYDTIDKLFDIVLQWDDDNSERAIQRCYANGIDTEILAEFFGRSVVAEAIYKYINNEEEFTEDEDEYEDEDKTDKATTPKPDYFRFIEMLDKACAPYIVFKENRMIEIKQDYEAISFFFDENFNLKEVMF